MKEVLLEAVNIGDILESPVLHNNKLLVKKGSVITERLLKRFKKIGIETVFISGEEDEIEEIEEINNESRKYLRGDFVFYQGDVSDGIYILQKGALDVIVLEDESDITEEKIIKNGKIVAYLSGENVNFGEIAALTGNLRTASIRAAEDSVVKIIPVNKKTFLQSIKQNPELGYNIALTISKRIKHENSMISRIDALYNKFSKDSVYNYNALYKITDSLMRKLKENRNEKWLKEIIQKIKDSECYKIALKYNRKSDLTEKEVIVKEKEYEKLEDEEIMCNVKKVAEFDPDEVICHQGDIGKELYVLINGRIGVYIADQRVGTISTRGCTIGEMAVILGYEDGEFEKRSATLKAITYTQIMVISGENLKEALNEDPGLIAQINNSLANMLPESNKAYLESRDRFLTLLSEFSKHIFVEGLYRHLQNHHDVADFVCPEEYKLLGIIKNKMFNEYIQAQNAFQKIIEQ